MLVMKERHILYLEQSIIKQQDTSWITPLNAPQAILGQLYLLWLDA